MIGTSVWLIAVPEGKELVERLDLKVLMTRALKIEERMKKGVNLEDEQRRYQILCDRMEYLGNLISTENEVLRTELGTEYLDLLLTIRGKFLEESKAARLMANFCPSHQIEKQVTLFADLTQQAKVADRPEVVKKIKFYRQAAKNKCHVLEIQELTVTGDEVTGGQPAGLKDQFLAMPVRDNISRDETNAFVSLRNQITTVISSLDKKMPAAVNFSDVPHNVIAEILHEFVYKNGKPMYLPIVYGDGSRAKPFPIHCLKPRDKKVLEAMAKYPVLEAGEISGRHHEIDTQTKIYFFRNQEISLGREAAVSDEAAYQKAKEIFRKMRGEGVYRIVFYQTGFQPAAVGFYRALTEEILERKESSPTLEVTPYYFFGRYEAGKTWI